MAKRKLQVNTVSVGIDEPRTHRTVKTLDP